MESSISRQQHRQHNQHQHRQHNQHQHQQTETVQLQRTQTQHHSLIDKTSSLPEKQIHQQPQRRHSYHDSHGCLSEQQQQQQEEASQTHLTITIADLCQQCNLLFCDVLHHVSIIATISKSHPSLNHRGYKHEELTGAYSAFRYVCQELRAYGRGSEALERRITRHGSGSFVVEHLKRSLEVVIRGLEEIKPVITKEIERGILCAKEDIYQQHGGDDDPRQTDIDINIILIQAQLSEDPDLAWFEKFVTESSLRCIIKGTDFLKEVAVDLCRGVNMEINIKERV